ncbi:GOLPH3/VPS74 family protein [Saccharothrix coeruleofusca]|uniref:Golgi phosphoprotein 3 GPP34 n=1 Tax=Saccharothrix coeruleofusca TaxID=33919 RepID=A0A918EAW9_9PSEU|nr:GPP34 family phosphoprotein [Saccharothrix coeruleofusca]MBP2340080.1 hypothetical protein [Saccharothrix coeruleofusca]GGP37483.1 hypothetical protein GCM10010185_06060 [Saccharothrix coeruleofusca]
MNLAEELALLAYDDSGAARVGQPALGYGLAGALLAELALAGRVDVVDRRVAVLDPTPPQEPAVRAVLARIAADKPRKPKWWVAKLSKGLTTQVLDGLVGAGVLRREKGRVLWVFPRTRYPSPGGREPEAETEARGRLVAAVTGDGPVEPRTAALGALVRAVRYDRQVFPDLPRSRVRTRLKEFSEGDWAATAVRKAIEEHQAATG